MQITIRTEQKKDYQAIKEVNDLAFEREVEGNLIEKLRKSQDYIDELSMVAEVDKSVVGHILFYPIQIVAKEATFPALALAPLAVMPAYQHNGVGKKLVKSGLKKAGQLGYPTVIVLGHQDYYPQFGFTPARQWNIKNPFEVPDDSFFAIELKEGALAKVHGTVAYPQEFYEV